MSNTETQSMYQLYSDYIDRRFGPGPDADNIRWMVTGLLNELGE